jgi:hypothetical protein
MVADDQSDPTIQQWQVFGNGLAFVGEIAGGVPNFV